MTEQDFFDLARQGYNRIPLCANCRAIWKHRCRCISNWPTRRIPICWNRWWAANASAATSFIGLPARTVLRVRAHLLTVETDGQVVEEHSLSDPLAFIAEFQARFKAAPVAGLPRFTGGLAGYFGYDTIRLHRKTLGGHPQGRRDPHAGHPADADRRAGGVRQSGWQALFDHPRRPARTECLHAGAFAFADLDRAIAGADHAAGRTRYRCAEPASEFGEAEFKAAVQKAKDYIAAGDIMQVVLSQRMARPFAASPLSLYRALRSLNPSPYMFFYDFGGFHVVGVVARNPGAS